MTAQNSRINVRPAHDRRRAIGHRPFADSSLAIGSASLLILYAAAALLGLLADMPRACPFYRLTGLDCPFCGLTRGLTLVGKRQPVRALHHYGQPLLTAFLAVALTGLKLGVQQRRSSGRE